MAFPLVYRSYAKVNLYLEVLQRRSDGYHNIETIFQTVGLFDEMRFVERPTGVSLTCTNPELEIGEMNLACRAAVLLRDRYDVTSGVDIHLMKNIPVAAGLAGGSGNAAASLIALNVLWDLRLSDSEIQRLALELGSDVPYCAVGGTMGATQRGEALFALPPLPPTWFVLVHPRIPVSAARVYNSPLLVRSTETPSDGQTPSFRTAVQHLNGGALDRLVFNRMETPVFANHSGLAEIKQRLLSAGCVAAAMSGSGPTLFGIATSRQHATKLAARFTDVETSIVQSVPRGVERM